MEPSLQLRGLSKSFGSKVAVSGLDLSIAPGTLCGLIGTNGAGKTTTIRIIMSIVMPDAGEVRVLGYRSALQARDRIGYLPEERGVYAKMRVEEYLVYIGQLKGLDALEATGRARRQLGRIGLGHATGNRLEELSKGMVQKVQFLAAILHEPDLIILDEPFSGLDPLSVRTVREMILEQRARGATILSTHVLAFAEELCDNVFMISEGRKVLDTPMATLRRRFVPRTLLLEPLDRQERLESIGKLPEVEKIEGGEDGTYSVMLREDVAPHSALARIAAMVPLVRSELRRPSLEDVFMSLSTPKPAGIAIQSSPMGVAS